MVIVPVQKLSGRVSERSLRDLRVNELHLATPTTKCNNYPVSSGKWLKKSNQTNQQNKNPGHQHFIIENKLFSQSRPIIYKINSESIGLKIITVFVVLAS